MLLLPEEMEHAPTQVRRVYQLISDTELEIPKATLATKLKGIDIEIFPTPPTSKKVPVLVTLSSCILRDIGIQRFKTDVRLCFSVGISWDRNVWKWGGDQVFLECFAKFHQSQTALFDENEADESLSDPEAADKKVDAYLGDAHADAPESRETPSADPLGASSKKNRGRARQGTKRTKALPFLSGRGRSKNSRPHA
jgi:hypothetical protein